MQVAIIFAVSITGKDFLPGSRNVSICVSKSGGLLPKDVICPLDFSYQPAEHAQTDELLGESRPYVPIRPSTKGPRGPNVDVDT